MLKVTCPAHRLAEGMNLRHNGWYGEIVSVDAGPANTFVCTALGDEFMFPSLADIGIESWL